MTDMGGTHGWLRDAGGGTERSMRPSIPIVRPTDEQLGIALGLPILTRHLVTNAVERVTWMGSLGVVQSAILKFGGFVRDSRERLLYHELLSPADGAPRLIQSFDTTNVDSRTARISSMARHPISMTEGNPSADWLLIEDVVGHIVDLDSPIEVAAIYRQLAIIHSHHRAPLLRYQSTEMASSASHHDIDRKVISNELQSLLEIQPLTLRSAAEGHERIEYLSMLVDRAIGDREIWEFSSGARDNITTLERWANSGLDRLLASGPVGLLHGDFQRNNWILEAVAHDSRGVDTDPENSAMPRVRILDWESAALGPGIIDLYYLAPDSAGAGHAPAGEFATVALERYMDQMAILTEPRAALSDTQRILHDAIIWGAIASTITRLADYFSELPMTRTPRGELPGAALDLLEYAASYVDRGVRTKGD